MRPDIVLLGPNQPFNEDELRKELRRRGLEVEVLRLSEVYRGCRLYSSSMIIEEVLARWRSVTERRGSQP